MLFGSFYHNLDDKNRLLLPSKLLSKLTRTLYMLKGFDGCISVYLEDSFDKYVNKLSELSYFEQKSRDFVRVALSSVVELEIDNSNRITIPVDVLRLYGIGKKVVIIGMNDHLEIWDENKWNAYQTEKAETFEALAESLESK